MSLNVQGLRSNFDELKQVLRKFNPDICITTETHITHEINTSEFNINGYKTVRANSHSDHTGGVIIYIKNGLKISNCCTTSSEMIWLASFDIIANDNVKVKIVGVYMSASESKMQILNHFENWLESNCTDCDIVICGDFNLDVSKRNTYGDRLLRICDEYGLKQCVDKFTRCTQISNTTIDLCLTNIRIDIKIDYDDQIADHANVIISFKCNKTDKKSKMKTIKTWRNYSQHELDDVVNGWVSEWSEIQIKSCDEKVEWLISRLSETANQFITEKTVKSDSDFFDEELEHMRREKNMLYKAAQFSDADQLKWTRYRMFRNQYKQQIKKKKYEYTQRRLNMAKGDIKGTWKVLKSILSNDQHEIEHVLNDGNIIENDKDIADEFNNYFVTAIEKIHSEIPQVDFENNINFNADRMFEFNKVNVSDVKKCLREFEKKSSKDSHNISIEFLLRCIDYIAVILTDIVNSFFEEAKFPRLLRESIIVPIQKVAGTIRVDEYRPINTLPCVEKLIEKLACDQFNKYISENNIICNEQSGFRNAHSCETALNNIIDEWKDALEDSNSILAVFLDFQKAFETIDRSILLNKLKSYRIGENALKFFSSYLESRTQRVKVNNVLSEPRTNNLGVPQGSILGPVLFIIYINDLKASLQYCKMKLFADDTLIYAYSKQIEESAHNLNTDLSNLYKAINQNKLKLNINKTKLMLITKKKNICTDLINIHIGTEKLEFVDQVKYLGVIVDNDLNFKRNFDYVIKKYATKVNVLARCSNKLNLQQKIQIYKAIIEPHVNYCSSILFLANKTEIDRLQKIQNRCMRNILKMSHYTSAHTLLEILEFDDIYRRITMNTLVMIYKIVNKLTPEYLSEKITLKADNPRRNTLRNRELINPKNCKKNYSQNSLFYKGINLYNSLPNHVKNVESTNNFKQKLRQYMQTNSLQ